MSLWVLNIPCFMVVLWVWLDQVARLVGPAIFEASKLKVLFLGVDENKHPGKLQRTYTLTHSDITSRLTLAISQTINNSQVISHLIKWEPNKFTFPSPLKSSSTVKKLERKVHATGRLIGK